MTINRALSANRKTSSTWWFVFAHYFADGMKGRDFTDNNHRVVSLLLADQMKRTP